MTSGNLFDALPVALPEEVFTTILASGGTRIERIVSQGQVSTPGFWYDQDEGEWVLLLQGGAKLLFEGEPATRELRPGDWVNILPHQKHRIEWTNPNEPTVWLAVFYPGVHQEGHPGK